MTANNKLLDATQVELDAIRRFFDEAAGKLRDGQVVNMDGLDKRVAAVCQTVQQATPELQHVYLPELTLLIELLNDYERQLRALQAVVANKKISVE